MTTLNSRLQLALLNRKKSRNLLEKGFTLVELMIVIVIVGILSAVALPNFLSQTSKAKATEAKTLTSSALKEAQIAWTETGTTGLGAWEVASDDADAPGQCPASTNTFGFTCDGSTPATVTVTAKGGADSGDLKDKEIVGSVDVTKGGNIAFCGDAPGFTACEAPPEG
ncbi:type IV pilin PilA [Synechococcus sp. MEDNS5]|uniref:type IV pilin protein n=1 Tax=Synechococcus sp. MEDNS5 TaxID=1442554 RepID=UPI001644B614|nr:type II secretion system protein [Synechococcus sp. MEDNS5]QNJ06682.1 type IV pilin PilA [Synechococcus sp. MEDNS5]